ncbi:MAG TPA: hypothetical protein VFE07_07860 [Marmoricola sp.]|jgi:hypothetical protein|nr:hypothetical protein [Marmoricola sp.]
MSDQPDEDATADTPGPGGPAAVSTGHPAVDEVLRTLGELDGRPVDEHVLAFEEAHETLRRTLSGAADETADQAADAGADGPADEATSPED